MNQNGFQGKVLFTEERIRANQLTAYGSDPSWVHVRVCLGREGSREFGGEMDRPTRIIHITKWYVLCQRGWVCYRGPPHQPVW